MVAKKKESQDEVLESGALTTTVTGADSGFDSMDFGIESTQLSLSQIPTLKLTQNMTPEVTNHKEYPDIYAGMYINDMTKEAKGEEIKFRMIRSWRQRVKFPPRDSGTTAIECSCPTYRPREEGDMGTTYGNCRTCVYNNFEEKEHCQQQYVMVIALNDNPHDLYRVILSKTSYSSGNKFDQYLSGLHRLYPKCPAFMFEGVLNAKEVKNPKIGSTYFISEIKVLAPKEEPKMDQALFDEFMMTYQEITEMRNRQIATSNQRAQEALAEQKDAKDSTEAVNTINSDISKDLGLEDMPEDTSTVPTEKTPF